MKTLLFGRIGSGRGSRGLHGSHPLWFQPEPADRVAAAWAGSELAVYAAVVSVGCDYMDDDS